jgi:pilus assembly protein TadC
MIETPYLAAAAAVAAATVLVSTRGQAAPRTPTASERAAASRVASPRHLPAVLAGLAIPATLVRLWRLVAATGRRGAADALGESPASLASLQPLQLRLIHAGYRDPSPRALRLRQLRAAAVLVVVGAGLVLALALPVALIAVLLVVAVPGGVLFVGLETTRRIAARQRAIRALAVPWLYQIAAFAAAGYALPDALREVERGEVNELSYETRRLLIQYNTGKPLRDALAVFALRCNCPELSTAVRRMVMAQGAGHAPLAESMRRIAAATRSKQRNERAIHRRRSINANYAFLALTAIPAIAIASAAPSLYEAALRLHGGG